MDEEHEDKQSKKPNQSDDDLIWLMGIARGRRVAWRILDRSGVFRLSFNTNALTMAFSEGCRNEGLRFIADINRLCPEQYQKMISENSNGRKPEPTA